MTNQTQNSSFNAASAHNEARCKKSADDFRKERDELDAVVADLSGLINALQFLCSHFGGMDLDRGTEVSDLRAALVGISDALSDRLSRA